MSVSSTSLPFTLNPQSTLKGNVMSTSVTRISTLLVTGIALGVTLGAVVLSTLPVWLGIAVAVAVCIVASLA